MEAVQFRDWRPWHAVREGEDRTYCGIQVFGAKRMWEQWEEHTDRCKQCVYVLRAKERTIKKNEIDADEIKRVVEALTPEEIAEIEEHGEDNMTWAGRMLRLLNRESNA